MLPEDIVEKKLASIQDGDCQAREDLISQFRPFIARAAMKVCGRGLEWDRDDELSIGLMAFDEALDRFDINRGVPFQAFARLIIRSRIMDYLRKQARYAAGSLGSLDDTEDRDGSPLEISRAWDQYLDQESAREREEEIAEYKKVIEQLGITFNDLIKCSPRHRDARATLLRVARVLAEDDLLFSQLMNSGKVPVLALARKAEVHVKIVERGRKYIIATSLIWRRCEDFLYLCTFIKPPGKES